MNILMLTMRFTRNWLTKNTEWFKRFSCYPGFFLILILIISCEEEGGYLGRQMLPSDDNIQVGYENNFDITASTDHIPPQYTFGIDTFLVGNLEDEKFGTVKASFASEITYDFTVPESYVGPNVNIHSPVLNLALLGTYGKEDVFPQLNVYQLSDIPDSNYYYSDANITDFKGDTLLNKELSRKDGNFIRIPLQEHFIQHITSFIEDDTLRFTYDSFKELYKGLYVEASQEEGSNALARFHLRASYLRFTIDSDSLDTKVYTMFFYRDTITFRANYIEHDRTNTEVEDAIGEPAMNKFYVQGFSGLQGKLKIEGLDAFKNSVNSNIAVNKATLFIPFDPDDNTAALFPRPSRLMLSFTNGELLPGSFNSGNTFPTSIFFVDRFNGKLNMAKGGYSFDISKYVQDYVNEAVSSNELLVFVPDLRRQLNETAVVESVRQSVTRTDRAVLVNDSSDRKISLEVFYNKLNE